MRISTLTGVMVALLAINKGAIAQNVGIGIATPGAKLEVDGGFAVTPATLAAGAAITVPDNETVLRITDDAANTAIAVANPATATEGQFLSIRNEDATNSATFAGTAISPGQMADFVYLNGGWRFRTASASGAGWGLTGNSGTAAGTNYIGTSDNVDLDVRTNNIIRARFTTSGAILIQNPSVAGNLIIGNTAAAITSPTGSDNTLIGTSAGNVISTGAWNTAVGSFALSSNNNGNGNTAVGGAAGLFNTNGTHNVFFGELSGSGNTTASQNSYFGALAGSNNVSGDNNTALGYTANFIAGNLTNATVIGANATVARSNSVVLGNNAVNVGIGAVNGPTARLHLSGAYANTFTTLAAGAAPAIANNVSHVRLTDDAAVAANAITGPAAPVDGQVLTIVNNDAEAATFAGATIAASTGAASFVYANGAWRVYGNSASASGWALAGNAGTGAELLGTTNAQPLRIITSGAERARVDANGNLGIGTTAPAERIHIVSTAANPGYSNFRIEDQNAASGANILLLNNGGVSASIGLNGSAHATAPNATYFWNFAAQPMRFGTNNTERVRIDANGNVGIGSAAPNALRGLQFGNELNNRRIVFWEDANNDHQFYGFGINPSTVRYQVANTAASHIFFAGTGAASSVEIMRVQGNGNVGINVATATARLHINGAYANTHTTVAAAGAPAIPTNVSHLRLTATGGVQANVLAAPAGPVEGQVLTIVNEDDNNARFGNSVIMAQGGVASYIYANGVWREMSNSFDGGDIDYPHGFQNMTAVNWRFNAGPYNVPAGKVLYVTSLSDYTNAAILINGQLAMQGVNNALGQPTPREMLERPFIVPQGGQVRDVTNQANNSFTGFLVDENPQFTPVVAAGGIVVPPGRGFVMLNYYQGGGTMTTTGLPVIDGQFNVGNIETMEGVLVFPAGTNVNGGGGNLFGYLRNW